MFSLQVTDLESEPGLVRSLLLTLTCKRSMWSGVLCGAVNVGYLDTPGFEHLWVLRKSRYAVTK